MMVVGLPHTPCRRSLQTTWRCCIQKIWCWAFRQKVPLKASGECKGAERKWTVRRHVEKVPCCLKHWFRTINVTNCSGNLLTGYRATGIKTAATLRRLLYRTWEAYLLMGTKLCKNSRYGEDCSTGVLQFRLQLNSALGRRSSRKRRTGS